LVSENFQFSTISSLATLAAMEAALQVLYMLSAFLHTVNFTPLYQPNEVGELAY